MKPAQFLLILFTLYLFSACDKDVSSADEEVQTLNGKVLPGVWELRAVYGGMIVHNPDNYKPGNGSLWAFTKTDFASIYKDSVYRSGNYTVSKETGTDLNTGRVIDQFIFNDEPAESFELVNDTLKLYYGHIAADGVVQMYVKIAEDTTSADD